MTRRDIVELPPDLAEKIAAGEVVSRPLSVVKELLENSIDAGAGTITIEIRDGGKSLIRVTDDGAGIPAGQIETAFRRHATSKLRSPEDLDAISTLGFRGEALTSIAAVSRMELVSKARGEKIGSLIRIEGGRTVERKPVGTADGVTAIVRDLFFNTPARLKFLKSERAEGALIADMASRMALAYPSVRMRLINNGSVLFSTSGRGSLMANILTVYGGGVGEGLLPVEASSDGLSVSGYVSPPSKSRSSRRGQSFFVNGRPVSSRAMERAVSEGYRETLFEGRHPIAFLFLSVPPERVDVNVHPAKSEVRLDDEEAVSAFVAAAVRKAIRVKESVASVPEGATYAVRASAPAAQTGGGAAAGEGAAAATGEGALTAAGAVGAGDPAPAEQIDIKNLLSGMRSESEAARRGDRVMETPGEAYAAAGGGFAIGAIEPLTTLFATYIAGVDGDSLYLIDQHAAHERILYEQLLRQYLGREKATQQLIAPLVAEAPFQGTGEWGECLAMLASMGYEAEEFGPKALRVRAIPAFMSVSEAEGVLAGVLEEAPGTAGAGGGAGAERLISAACKRAVKANDRLADAEIRALLAGLERCENPYSCPHGRPIFIRLRRRDIERMFKRA
jgi:DNA mismatch repair protein MutL